MKKLIPIFIVYITTSFFTGMSAFAADSDEERVKPIKTATIFTYDGDAKEREVSGAQAACELAIKSECSINDCSDRNWKVEGTPEVAGTYVNCEYSGDNGLKWESSPATVKVICPENAEASWDGETSYCKCITDFVERAGTCVAKVDAADEPSQSVAVEEPPANPDEKPGDITSKVKWVDENATMPQNARDYNDAAEAARSNAVTRNGQAPALERTMPDGKTRLVRFDGVEGDVLIDRKISIRMNEKVKNQARRQSDALTQNGLTGRWEVSNEAQAARATKMFNKLEIKNIEVKVVKP